METPAPKQRHVSRWRLAAGGSGTIAERRGGGGDASAEGAASAQPAHMSLRYLNEFVGNLQCAPALLQHGLFPDAKEITEVRSQLSRASLLLRSW